jgi:hypothetical protein
MIMFVEKYAFCKYNGKYFSFFSQFTLFQSHMPNLSVQTRLIYFNFGFKDHVKLFYKLSFVLIIYIDTYIIVSEQLLFTTSSILGLKSLFQVIFH